MHSILLTCSTVLFAIYHMNAYHVHVHGDYLLGVLLA